MKSKLLILLVLALILFLGCAKQEKAESRNMEQIHAEEGIPVKVIVMQPQEFAVELPFTATVSGLRQSAAAAMIGGRIEKVLVKVGDYMMKDQVMFEFPEDAPAGQLTQAQSAYELAEATYNRMKNLFAKGGISKQDLEGVEMQYKVSAANLDAVQQMLKVRAPIEGYVTSINVRETDGVHAEDVLAFVSQTKQMKARIWAAEDEVCLIGSGQKATVTWNNTTLMGKVSEVAISMDREHNAFGVELIFDNAKNLCKSGVIGDVRILTYTNETALLVPRKNVMNDEKGVFVYVVEGDIAAKRYIKVGHKNSNFEILEGLNSGDRVISEGLNLVYENAKVKVVADSN
ncbi:MAG: efflux RND transporter periplasmic adaptor subunit [Candidatus Cloacimonadales bacterium]|nr:efflux RND transporter periplasmic adaptor subunit [Candidatus Cloacimonadales bacterium]